MKKKFIYFLTLVFALCACSKDKYENNLPYVDVYFVVSPITDFGGILQAPGKTVFVGCNHNGGQSCGYNNHGIIVCSMMQSETYAAYLATCPRDSTKLQVMDGRILKAKCNKCNSEFDLENNGLSGNLRLIRYNIQNLIANKNFIVSSR